MTRRTEIGFKGSCNDNESEAKANFFYGTRWRSQAEIQAIFKHKPASIKQKQEPKFAILDEIKALKDDFSALSQCYDREAAITAEIKVDLNTLIEEDEKEE